MEKKLTDNQKKIINSLVEEFTKENVTAKKINSKSLINQIEDKLSLVNKQEDEVRKYNILEGKKTEAFLEDLIKKIAPITKKYSIEVTRSYKGMGVVSRNIYLSFKAFWVGYGDTKITRTFNVGNMLTYENVGLFSKQTTTAFNVGYPTYQNGKQKIEGKNQEEIIDEIVKWIIFYKEQEIKDIAISKPSVFA